jgi:hypothetical protein
MIPLSFDVLYLLRLGQIKKLKYIFCYTGIEREGGKNPDVFTLGHKTKSTVNILDFKWITWRG